MWTYIATSGVSFLVYSNSYSTWAPICDRFCRWQESTVFFLLCWGQPLWVILCRLPEKGRKEMEEVVEEMKERDREERGKWKKVKEQKKRHYFPSTLTCCRPTVSQYQLDAPVTKATEHLRFTQPPPESTGMSRFHVHGYVWKAFLYTGQLTRAVEVTTFQIIIGWHRVSGLNNISFDNITVIWSTNTWCRIWQ